jgi:hypothetical protein
MIHHVWHCRVLRAGERLDLLRRKNVRRKLTPIAVLGYRHLHHLQNRVDEGAIDQQCP